MTDNETTENKRFIRLLFLTFCFFYIIGLDRQIL